MGLGKYLKEAFKNRWNLLLLAGALGFAVLSGGAGVVVPLVLAGEVGFLAVAANNPRFRKVVDARHGHAEQARQAKAEQAQLATLLATLSPDRGQRYEYLRARCLEIRRLARELRGPGPDSGASAVEEMQLAGLDRLLRVHLRLLSAQQTFERFLQATDQRDIERNVAELERRLAGAGGADSTQARIAQSIRDNLATCRQRLENLRKQRSSHELMTLEINRLENKIQALSELALNREKPERIAGQVDETVGTLLDAEKVLDELDFATGRSDGEPLFEELERGAGKQAAPAAASPKAAPRKAGGTVEVEEVEVGADGGEIERER
ncbi:MAG: hypothetical protein HY905_21860 [Deltaproteobacteria bacterium]|nr:hypothetical protein [Deltaproteobacteria bacterium]